MGLELTGKPESKVVSHFQDNKVDRVSHSILSKDWTHSYLGNLTVQKDIFPEVFRKFKFAFIWKKKSLSCRSFYPKTLNLIRRPGWKDSYGCRVEIHMQIIRTWADGHVAWR